MARGRVEARITVPTGGWSVSLTITAIGGPYPVTVAAGNCFPTDLLSSFQTQLDAATGGDGAFTVSASWGESGTGFVTIAHATQTFTLAWTSTDLRDVLGFTGTLTPAALTFTGTLHARGVWLPNCEMDVDRGTDGGIYETDRGVTVSPQGDVYGLVYNTRQRHDGFTWPHVTHGRAQITYETTTGESFEQWWRDTHSGLRSYFEAVPQLRIYFSADAGAYYTFREFSRTDTEAPRFDAQWRYLRTVRIGPLYRVPGT